MPRQKTVLTLKQACLHNIAEHMETLWAPRGFAAVEKGRLSNTDGDFDQLRKYFYPGLVSPIPWIPAILFKPLDLGICSQMSLIFSPRLSYLFSSDSQF